MKRQTNMPPSMVADLKSLVIASKSLPKDEQSTLLAVLGVIAVLDAAMSHKDFNALVVAGIATVFPRFDGGTDAGVTVLVTGGDEPDAIAHHCADTGCPFRGVIAPPFNCNTSGSTH